MYKNLFTKNRITLAMQTTTLAIRGSNITSSSQNAMGLFLQDASHRLFPNKALLHGRTLLKRDFKACFTDTPTDYSISTQDRSTFLHTKG
jgi:hypothetical protein